MSGKHRLRGNLNMVPGSVETGEIWPNCPLQMVMCPRVPDSQTPRPPDPLALSRTSNPQMVNWIVPWTTGTVEIGMNGLISLESASFRRASRQRDDSQLSLDPGWVQDSLRNCQEHGVGRDYLLYHSCCLDD